MNGGKSEFRTDEARKEIAIPHPQRAQARDFRKMVPADSPEQKLVQLKVVVAAAFLLGFCLSWRLWLSSRLFPLSPVSHFLPAIPSPLDAVWMGVLLGLLVLIVIVPRPRRLIAALLVTSGLLALWDQERWQPWFVEYFFLLTAIAVHGWKKSDPADDQALQACRLIVVATYIWSGVQKLNANFIRETWPDIAGPLLHFLPKTVGRFSSFLGLMVPFLEILIGLALLTRRFRRRAVVLAVATHAFILALLISSGENTVVWPWNAAMAFLVLLLFWQERTATPANLLVPQNAFHRLGSFLFGLLPALSFFDLWDSYLSAALYSGNTDQAVIYLSPAVISRLPAELQPHIWQSSRPLFLDMT